MNKRFPLALIFALAFGAMGSAFAADLPITPKQRAAPQQTQQTANNNWSGGQVGGSNGVSSVNNNFVEPGAYVCPAAFPYNVSCFETPFAFRGHPLSYTIGPFIGYRWQFGNSVVGVEGDWSWKKAENTALVSMPFVCFDAGCFNYRSDTKFGSIKQTWDSSIRLRYGWLVTPQTLVYGTAGVAIGQISGSFAYNGQVFVTTPFVLGGSTATSRADWSDTRVGGTVGAGVEMAIWGAWKARVEYRYTDFGSYTKTVGVTTVCAAPTGCSAPSSSATIDVRESFHTVRVGLGFDF